MLSPLNSPWAGVPRQLMDVWRGGFRIMINHVTSFGMQFHSLGPVSLKIRKSTRLHAYDTTCLRGYPSASTRPSEPPEPTRVRWPAFHQLPAPPLIKPVAERETNFPFYFITIKKKQKTRARERVRSLVVTHGHLTDATGIHTLLRCAAIPLLKAAAHPGGGALPVPFPWWFHLSSSPILPPIRGHLELSSSSSSAPAPNSTACGEREEQGGLGGQRERDGDLRVVEARGAGAGRGRERGVRHGRPGRRRRRRGRGRPRRPQGGLPLLPEGQEGAQPGRRHPLPGIRRGGRRVLRRLRRARQVRAVGEQAGAGLPPLHDPQPPERAPPGLRRRRRRRRRGLQRRVAVVVHGRQRGAVAVAGAAAGGVAGGLRQRVRGHGQGAQAPGRHGLQLQRHHGGVRHQAGQGPRRRQPRRLQGGARDHVGDGLPQRRAAHHRPEAQRASGGGADQALQRPRVRAQGRAVGAARVAARRGLPGARHGAVAGRLPAQAPRRGVGAAGDAPPRRAGGPVHHPGHGRRVGRAEQRGGGVHRVRHAAQAARVQGRGGGRGAAVARQVPGVTRRRLLRRLPLPAGPGLGHHRRRRQGEGSGREGAERPLIVLADEAGGGLARCARRCSCSVRDGNRCVQRT